MYLSQIEKTLYSFAKSHRDNRTKRRYSTMITGGAGIGKTESVKRLATDLDMGVVIVHVAQLEPGDLLGIPRSKPFFFDDTIEEMFKKAEESDFKLGKAFALFRYVFEWFFKSERYTIYDLPNYLPHYKKDKQGNIETWIDEDGIERKKFNLDLLGAKLKNKKDLIKKHGKEWRNKVKGIIIFLDEINRAVADDTKNAIFELPGDYALHEYEVPEQCVIFAAGNPPTDDYQVNEMDQEKAWMDRFVHIRVEGKTEDSLIYMEKNNYEHSIISFINADPNALMEKEAFYELNVKRTPRSYDMLNNILKYVELPEEDSIRREIFMGILGDEYGNNFTNHLKDNLEIVPSGEDIVFHYPLVRERVLNAVNENEMDFINQVIRYFYSYLAQEENVEKNLITRDEEGDVADLNDEYIQNIENFLLDLPAEVRMSIVKQIVVFDYVNDALGLSPVIFDTLSLDSDNAFNDI